MMKDLKGMRPGKMPPRPPHLDAPKRSHHAKKPDPILATKPPKSVGGEMSGRKPVTDPITEPPRWTAEQIEQIKRNTAKIRAKMKPPAELGHPPAGSLPPLPEVYSNEDDPPLNLDCRDEVPVQEPPFWHSHLFIIGLMIVALVIMIVGIAWSMKP